MALTDLLTDKQIQVVDSYLYDDWKFLILVGAVRSGKTIIDNYLFLLEIRRVAKLAKENGDTHPRYILGGASSSAIYNNVISELEKQFGLDLHIDRHGHYIINGVDIIPAYTGTMRGLKSIRGLTAYGAYINEASLATFAVFQEILQRCSQPNSRIICDSNPDIPTHWLKEKYIDNTDPEARIKSFHFTLLDNKFIDEEYKKNLIAITPKGMFYNRNILGQWSTGEGIVYSSFDAEKMVIDKAPDDLTYYVGVDWGFEHKNSMIVFGDDSKGNTYLIKEYTGKHEFIEHWVDIAHKIQDKYGHDINFWCDSARPDNVNKFVSEDINAYNADKSINAGVENVAQRMTAGKFFVVKGGAEDFFDEIYQYVWDKAKGMPKKEHDDVMDAMRYGIYTQHKDNGISFMNNGFF